MTGKFLSLTAASFVVLLFTTTPFIAHHSEAAQFDTTKPVKVSGVVKKVEWMNPHIWFYIDVKDEKGNVTTWGFSGLPPGMAIRKGFTKDTLKLAKQLWFRDFERKMVRTTHPEISSPSRMAGRFFQAR